MFQIGAFDISLMSQDALAIKSVQIARIFIEV
jgi:hypothetical protein